MATNQQMAERFGNAIELHIGKVEKRFDRIEEHSAEIAFRSVTIGSAITGSPGQPVESGALLKSWRMVRVNRWTREAFSPLIYAPLIEEGIGRYGPLTLRSKVGGFHSLRLTAAGWQRIVDLVTRDELAAS